MFEFDVLLMVGLKVLFALLMIGAVMTMAGYSVLAERKVSAWMQGRVGPNRTVLPLVGHIPFLGSFLRGLGMFQPLADGLKFLFKEEIMFFTVGIYLLSGRYYSFYGEDESLF